MAEQPNNSIIKVEGIELDFIRKNDFFENPTEDISDLGDLRTKILRLRDVKDFNIFEVQAVVPYTDAADSNFYPIFYVANVKSFLIEARKRHGANGGASAAVTVEKLEDGVAKGSGKSILESAFDLTANANRTERKSATTILSALEINPGEALALRPSGTLTNCQNVVVTVLLGIHNKNIPPGVSASPVLAGV